MGKFSRLGSAMILALGLSACGQETPVPASEAQVSAAQERVQTTVNATNTLHAALALSGLVPDYTCGTARGVFRNEVAHKLAALGECVTLTLEPGEDRDIVRAHFEASGCRSSGLELQGDLVYTLEGGDQRFALSADYRGLLVSGRRLAAQTRVASCGAERQYSAHLEGPIAEGYFVLDAAIAQRNGWLNLEGTELTLDATAVYSTQDGEDRVTVTGLQYEVGDFLPSAGRLVIETASGSEVFVGFVSEVPVVGLVQIQVDEHPVVEVPVVREWF